MTKYFSNLLDLAQKKGPKKMAVAVAEDINVLGAIKEGTERKIIEPILVGNEQKIREISKKLNFDLSSIKIIDEKNKEMGCRKAVSLVNLGEADILMKGLIDTAIIMKQVLNKDVGLRTEKIISHIAVFSIPTYHKILMVTDVAMNIYPNLEEKKEIIKNAVEFAHNLSIEKPKVAVIGAREKVSSKMEATVHAKELVNMNRLGEITGCTVEGPLALDNAISREAAIHKGIESDIAGDVDILLMPNIDAGNILYKSLTFFAKAENAGIIVGTKAPIVLTSRTDTRNAKLNSIALGVLMTSRK